MSLPCEIKDAEGKYIANVIQREGINCIPVLTTEYKKYLNKSVYFQSPVYGTEMAQNFSQVGSTENVHDGNDNTYWTATTITGHPRAFNFSSTSRPHTGSQSIEITDKASDNDVFQLANDTIIDPSAYDILSGWIYVKQNWSSEDRVLIYFYNTTTGENANGSIDLTNYINETELGVWQKFNIPFDDFSSLNEYDAIRFSMDVNSRDNPEFFLDDIVLQSLATSSAIFKIEPPKGKWWNVVGFGIVIVSQYDTTKTDATVPKIPHNGLLGTSLTNGITYQRQEGGEIIFSGIFKDLIDILNQHNAYITSQGDDGNYSWIKIDMNYDVPFVLKSEWNDYISFSLADDLSTLHSFRVVSAVKEEPRHGEKYVSEGNVYA